MIVTLEEAKEWLAVDHELHDQLITNLIDAATLYIKNGTGNEFDSTNSLAKQLCLVLVTDMYETRTFTGPSESIRYIVNSMIQQLTYCYGSETE